MRLGRSFSRAQMVVASPASDSNRSMNVMHSRSLPGGFLVSNRISRARSSAGLSLFVEAVDLPAEVLVDLIPLDLHRRRDLAIFLRQRPVGDRELLDLLDLRKLLVGLLDRLLRLLLLELAIGDQ